MGQQIKTLICVGYIDRYRVVKMITRCIFLNSTNLVLKGCSATSSDGKHWNGLSISNTIQTCTKRGHTTVGWIYITSWIFLLCLTFLYLNIYPWIATWKMYRFYRQSTVKRPRQWRRAFVTARVHLHALNPFSMFYSFSCVKSN